MIKWGVIISVAVLGSTLLAQSVSAQPRTEAETEKLLTRTDFARGGYFFAITGFAAVENSPLIGQNNTYIVSGGFDMRAGARHNRWFATDLTGQYVHNFVSGSDAFLAWGITANERFYFTKRRFQPYVAAGLGFLNIKARKSPILTPAGPVSVPTGFSPGFVMRFGAGLESYVNESFIITLDCYYNLPVGKIDGFDYIAAGLGLQFF
jgi:opacity protein-like surface antigen